MISESTINKVRELAIEDILEEQDKEQTAKNRHKETLLAMLGHIQDFFIGSLLMPDNDESRLAREYAYGRWKNGNACRRLPT